MMAIFVTLGAIGYLGYSLWSVGGPYNVDSDGCGRYYVSVLEGEDASIPVCQNDLLVTIAKFLTVSGFVMSVVTVVLLLMPAKNGEAET